VRPHGVEKEQSLTQKFWKATAAGSTAGLMMGSPQVAFSGGLFIGAVYYYYQYFERKNSPKLQLDARNVDILNQITNPQAYKPFVSNVPLDENKIIFNFYYEERLKKSSKRKTGVSNVVYEEE
jgi:hypothetical protein